MAYPAILHISSDKQKGSNGIYQNSLAYGGKEGVSPHINTRTKKLSMIYSNV